jgi:DNA (cytosine-5)-methyltransferase 1
MAKIMTHGSLFSGREGFGVGAEAAGVKTAWTAETDEFLHHKLRKLFPHATHYRNVKDVRYPEPVDILSAGFPCQDISVSNWNSREGIRGSRSGLWTEVARIADEIKPSYILLENSPQLLRRGFEYALRDLSAIGYDAEWDCWRAQDFGYPHNRLRVYVIAYARSLGRKGGLLRPPGAFALSQTWTPTEAYLRVTGGRADGWRDTPSIQRGDVVPNFSREIHAFGNAAMPVITEHLFKCIIYANSKLYKS